MGKRQRLLLASLVALTAVSALTLRPVGIKMVDIPLDLHSVEVVGLSGSSNHCVLITDCETVLTAGTSVDLIHSPLLPLLVGFSFVVLATATLWTNRPDSTVANPPPRFASF